MLAALLSFATLTVILKNVQVSLTKQGKIEN